MTDFHDRAVYINWLAPSTLTFKSYSETIEYTDHTEYRQQLKTNEYEVNQ